MVEKWICFCFEKWHQWSIVSHLIILFCLTFFREERRENIHKENCRRQKRKMESKRKPGKLQFQIHMANKFYGKLYCGRSCSCGKNVRFPFSLSLWKIFLLHSKREKPSLRFYSFWNVLQILHIFLILTFIDTPDAFLLTFCSFSLCSWRLFMENCLSFQERKAFNLEFSEEFREFLKFMKIRA